MIQEIELKEKESINKIVLHQRSKYLCEMNDNTLIWMYLDDKHAKVQQYKTYLQERPQPPTKDGLLLVTNDNWYQFFSMPFEFEGEPKEQEIENTNSSNITSTTTSNITPTVSPTISNITSTTTSNITPTVSPTISNITSTT
eukprot:160008_1